MRPNQYINTNRLHLLEYKLAKEGRLFQFGTMASITYDAVKRCRPLANPEGQIFEKTIRSLNVHIYKELTQLMWETILEGHEFVFPYGVMSFILVESLKGKKLYMENFGGEIAIYVEMRQKKKPGSKVYKPYYHGTLLAEGIKQVKEKLDEGVKYTRRKLYYVENKYQ